jgi:hypothetical protein
MSGSKALKEIGRLGLLAVTHRLPPVERDLSGLLKRANYTRLYSFSRLVDTAGPTLFVFVGRMLAEHASVLSKHRS